MLNSLLYNEKKTVIVLPQFIFSMQTTLDGIWNELRTRAKCKATMAAFTGCRRPAQLFFHLTKHFTRQVACRMYLLFSAFRQIEYLECQAKGNERQTGTHIKIHFLARLHLMQMLMQEGFGCGKVAEEHRELELSEADSIASYSWGFHENSTRPNWNLAHS